MKITIKTLQQKVFQIDADAADTVEDLKKKICDVQGHPVDTQKLIYAGRVLLDSKTVESCEIKEKDFLVLMVAKLKPTFTTPAPSTSIASAEPAAPPPPPVQPAAPVAPESAPAPSLPIASASSTGDFLTADALQSARNNMLEMGFPLDQVNRALKASFNNPERAVEYLMTGIPSHIEAEPGPAARTAPVQAAPITASAPAPAPAPSGGPQNLFQLAQQRQQQQGGGVAPAPGVGVGAGAGAGGLGGLAGLGGAGPMEIRHEDLLRLRDAVRENPVVLQQLIQQIGVENPELASMLAANPEQVLNQLLQAADHGGIEGQEPPPHQVVNVTPEERDAIERLEALGFTRAQVIQAYFACDKNEDWAANYLFEHGYEED